MFQELIDSNWEILDILLVAVGLVIYVGASHTLHQRRHPSAAIAWVLGILLVPYITLPLYLAFGTRKIVPQRVVQRNLPLAPSTPEQTTAARTQQLGQVMGLPPPKSYESLQIHEDGQQALTAMRRIIKSARQTLEISTFLLGRDVLGKEISARLKQRARAGVRVRLLIDGVGFYMGGHPELEGLRAAGVEVVLFVSLFRSPRRGRTNLRNHRKMLIADGKVLWCGGRNLAAEYFEGGYYALRQHAPWIDLSFDLRGALVHDARWQFEEDWAFAKEQATPDVPPVPLSDPATSSLAQLVVSGPDHPDDTIHTLLISTCFSAQQRILAITPYFVPDQVLLMALMLAARRGVRVELVIPAHSNHRLADIARHRALRDLVSAGGLVWLHPEMVHAKAVLVDEDLALVGSANLDSRSLFLNYEMMVAFYDQPTVAEFARWVEARRQETTPYLARHPGVLRSLVEGIVLWLAFQL